MMEQTEIKFWSDFTVELIPSLCTQAASTMDLNITVSITLSPIQEQSKPKPSEDYDRIPTNCNLQQTSGKLYCSNTTDVMDYIL